MVFQRTAAAILCLTLAAPAAAQEIGSSDDYTLLEGWDVSGVVELGLGFDDNVYAQRNDKVSDGLWILTPELALTLEGEVVDLKLYGEAELGRYWSEGSEDYDDLELGTTFSIDLEEEREIFGGLSYAWEHEDRSSPDAVNGLEPQQYTNPRAHVGYGATYGLNELRIGGTYERLDFDDVPAIPDPIDGDLRDRNLYTGGARVGRDIGGNWQLFGQGYADLRRYDEEVNAGGSDRDSSGGTLAGGVRYELGRQLEFEALLGLMYQSYDDPGFDQVVAPDFGALLDWRVNRRTRLYAYVERTLEETTAAGSPGIVSTAAGMTVSRLLRRDLSLYGGVDVIQDAYHDIGRDEITWLADAGLRYYLNPWLYLDTNYSFARRDSSLSAFDYDNHQVFFSVGAQLDERYPDGAEASFAAPEADGFYLGAELPLGSLHSEQFGERGNGGTLSADFGAFGAGTGLFGGYGLTFDGWYLGGELDASWSAAEWNHDRSPNGRVFSVEKEGSLGASLMSGYRLETGAFPYGRVGAVVSRFDSDYRTSRGSQFQADEDLFGMRLGGGLELPAGDGVFLRMDYGYTSYADYDLAGDNFANSESQVRLGIGYRFGAPETVVPLPRYEPEGFYLGALGAIPSLFSEISGPRSNQFGASRLEADFAEDGLALGGFAGYGESFDAVYLGVEGDLEAGTTQPDHERIGGGRTFSVDRQWSAGFNARLGYSLGAGGMVYLRGGPVLTGFETDYSRDSTAVTERGSELGWRLGVGLETPLDDELFLRLDYSYSDYGDYELTYAPGETDSFDNSESLFRVGLGWRF